MRFHVSARALGKNHQAFLPQFCHLFEQAAACVFTHAQYTIDPQECAAARRADCAPNLDAVGDQQSGGTVEWPKYQYAVDQDQQVDVTDQDVVVSAPQQSIRDGTGKSASTAGEPGHCGAACRSIEGA